MSMLFIVRLTWCLQILTSIAGALAIWTAWLAFDQGRIFAAGLDSIVALLNASLFCANGAIRAKWHSLQ
jgi:ammonia channel protein AmtB